MQKVIIAGYPKSGNTWLARLSAELIECPVGGFLYYSEHPELAIEGLNRVSDYCCYKSHHQLHEISRYDQKNAKIVYIVRDPRDILLSGSHYFFKRENLSNSERLNRMTKAIFEGDITIHYWCRMAWDEHVKCYLDAPQALVLKYEDLIDNTFESSSQLLEFLGLQKSDEEIRIAIDEQSFDTKKKKFENSNPTQFKFLRKGTKEQWKSELNSTIIKQYNERFESMFRRLNYSFD